MKKYVDVVLYLISFQTVTKCVCIYVCMYVCMYVRLFIDKLIDWL